MPSVCLSPCTMCPGWIKLCSRHVSSLCSSLFLRDWLRLSEVPLHCGFTRNVDPDPDIQHTAFIHVLHRAAVSTSFTQMLSRSDVDAWKLILSEVLKELLLLDFLHCAEKCDVFWYLLWIIMFVIHIFRSTARCVDSSMPCYYVQLFYQLNDNLMGIHGGRHCCRSNKCSHSVHKSDKSMGTQQWGWGAVAFRLFRTHQLLHSK